MQIESDIDNNDIAENIFRTLNLIMTLQWQSEDGLTLCDKRSKKKIRQYYLLLVRNIYQLLLLIIFIIWIV